MLRLPKTDIPFLRYYKGALVISGLALAAGVFGVWKHQGLNPGIDFTGGLELQARFEKDIEIAKVRGALPEGEFSEVTVQTMGTEANREFLIKLKGSQQEVGEVLRKIEDKLTAAVPDNRLEIRRAETVGPAVGKELKRKGILAFIFANVGILVYLAFRFHWAFGVGAVLALVHDGLISGGWLVLFGYETTITSIAAVLTVIGYSVNDTIVIYDRVREDLHKYRKDPLDVIINRAVNETLPRTILTSLTVLFVAATLYIFGGSAVESFGFAMVVGTVSGTFSTIFIASPVLLVWRKRIAPGRK